MKKLNKTIVNAIVSIARKGIKDDINSTGSPWVFQPKIPKEAFKFKNSKK